MPYEYLEDVAIADIAFRARGRTLEEAFTAAADAVTNAMVEKLDSLEPRETRAIEVEAEALDLLLFQFLQELIFYKDAEQLLLRVPQVQIEERPGGYRLRAQAQGERLDPAKHHLRVDVKAVTLHRFSLESTPGGWDAFVILDI